MNILSSQAMDAEEVIYRTAMYRCMKNKICASPNEPKSWLCDEEQKKKKKIQPSRRIFPAKFFEEEVGV